MNTIQRFGRSGRGDERVVIFPSRAKLALLVAGSLAFVAGGVGMVSCGRLGDGLVGIVFFGVCSVYPSWRLVVSRPVLVIDRQGIDVKPSPAGGHRIPWSEIAGCGVWAFNRQQWVEIDLVDPAAHFARLGPVWCWLAQLSMALRLPPVLIPQSLLPRSAGEIVTEIEWFRFQAFGR